MSSDPVQFDVPGRPVGKQRPRVVHHDRHGNPLSRPRAFTPRRTIAYEETIAWAARASGLRLTAGVPIRLDVQAYFNKGPWPDADNILKSVADGLQRAFPEWDDRDAVSVACVRVKAPVGVPEFTRVLVEVLT